MTNQESMKLDFKSAMIYDLDSDQVDEALKLADLTREQATFKDSEAAVRQYANEHWAVGLPPWV